MSCFIKLYCSCKLIRCLALFVYAIIKKVRFTSTGNIGGKVLTKYFYLVTIYGVKLTRFCYCQFWHYSSKQFSELTANNKQHASVPFLSLCEPSKQCICNNVCTNYINVVVDVFFAERSYLMAPVDCG